LLQSKAAKQRSRKEVKKPFNFFLGFFAASLLRVLKDFSFIDLKSF